MSALFLLFASSAKPTFAEEADSTPPPASSSLVSSENPDKTPSKPKKVKKGKKAQNGDKYIRVVRDKKKKSGTMDTSIQHFEGENGVSVDLIGAVHIGEKSYYKKLNDLFKSYDAVLYEVVAEEGTRPKKEERRGRVPSVIGLSQQKFADVLGLVHQLEYIDYQAENMVHADMTPSEFAAASKAREDGFSAWYLRSVGYSMGKTDTSNTDAKVIMAFFSKNRKKAMKSAMSDQFVDMDGQIDAMQGDAEGTSIISDRNNKVLKKLTEVIQKGEKKKIAIFYGAAHLPDFAEKLEKNFKFVPKDITWIPAWVF